MYNPKLSLRLSQNVVSTVIRNLNRLNAHEALFIKNIFKLQEHTNTNTLIFDSCGMSGFGITVYGTFSQLHYLDTIVWKFMKQYRRETEFVIQTNYYK